MDQVIDVVEVNMDEKTARNKLNQIKEVAGLINNVVDGVQTVAMAGVAQDNTAKLMVRTGLLATIGSATAIILGATKTTLLVTQVGLGLGVGALVAGFVRGFMKGVQQAKFIEVTNAETLRTV